MFPSLAPFAFAVFFISVLSTKLLHLAVNAPAIPTAVFVLCLPAVFFVDVVLLAGVWFLLRRKSASWLSFCGALLGFTICFITLGAASSQWGFFYQTGGQVRWADAKAYANKDTVKVLLSESNSALAFGSGIVSVACITRNMLYRFVGAFVTAAESQIIRAFKLVAARFDLLRWKQLTRNPHAKEGSSDALLAAEEGAGAGAFLQDDADSDDNGPPSDSIYPPKIEQALRMGPFVWWLLVSAATLTIFYIIVAFDPYWPHAEVMTTLPLPLLAAFAPRPHECFRSKDTWPFPDLITGSKWVSPNGDFKGWAPGPENDLIRSYWERIPPWLPNPAPPGFSRWDEHERLVVFGNRTGLSQLEEDPSDKSAKTDDGRCPEVEEEPFYNPVSDPLKITNLDDSILHPIQQALKEVQIKHVALIKLESTRQELFPLRKGSDIYNFIMESNVEADRPNIDKLLSQLTPNAEKLTGRPGNFRTPEGTAYEAVKDEWTDPAEADFGGINVVGSLTPSSVSTKSLAASHCGVWPLPVDTFEEADSQSYQPCIPQVLNLFNQQKTNRDSTPFRDFRDSRWNSAFIASVVDDYDRQHKFEETIGFETFINRDTIAEGEEHDSTGLEEINYFGYPETALERYVKEYIAGIADRGERMFFSHFTSTTHHPWAVPSWFQSVDYMGDVDGAKSSHEHFNQYLNTVRFVDTWLGRLMRIFEETGIANETLVVFVGDHGQAFSEDFKKTGTYENGHISNYRVPLTFRHPRLPRLQYEANATSLSILPTILDLLINTGSLNQEDLAAASDLVQDYEGQSLIRPYRRSVGGRRAWNFGIVNPGGRLLTVTSADAPWRLVMPISDKAEYVFTDLGKDPLELHRLSDWGFHGLVHAVHHEHGAEAARWAEEAEAVAKWWTRSRKRLWRYRPE